MRFQESVGIFLSVGLALGFALPGGKSKGDVKTNDRTAASGLEEKSIESSITKEVNAGDDEGIDLLRAKKSPPTTTFCVEIKPGTDDPIVVVCDPNKKDQQLPFPDGGSTTIFPKPPIPDYIPNIPSIIPGNQQPQEPPLIFIPQPPSFPQLPQLIPQIFNPQPQLIPQIFNPQPQIIFVRDPSCNSNTPPFNPYPWLGNLSPTGGTYIPGNPIGPKSALPPMNIGHDHNGEFWKSGFNLPQDEQIRSFGAAPDNSFSNPMDLIYSRKGPATRPPQQNPPHQQQQNPSYQQQQNQNQKPVLPPGFPQLPQQNLDPDGQYDRPLLIQCNPMIIPLSPEAYSAATGTGDYGGWNKPWSRSANSLGSSQIYTPMVSGSQGIYMAPNGYQRQSFIPPTGMINPQSQMSGNMMTSQGQLERNAMVEGGGEGRGENVPLKEQDVKGGRGMPQEQHQQQSSGVANPSTYVKGIGSQPVSNEQQAPHLMTHETHQQGLTKGQNIPGNGFQNGEPAAAHFSQGGINDKEQGFQQRQFQEFSQPQNHGQHVNQPVGRINHSSGQLSNPEDIMRRMKAPMPSNNNLQPFMMPVGITGEKSTQSKA